MRHRWGASARFLGAVFKRVVSRYWKMGLTPKTLALSLKKLSQIKKKERPRNLGGPYNYDVWFVIFLNSIVIEYI